MVGRTSQFAFNKNLWYLRLQYTHKKIEANLKFTFISVYKFSVIVLSDLDEANSWDWEHRKQV